MGSLLLKYGWRILWRRFRATKDKMRDELKDSLAFIKSRVDVSPKIGVILGSGLGYFAEEVEEPIVLEGRDVPYYPTPAVEGHAGRLVFGKISGVDVLILQGRVHLYEGYSIREVTYPVHLLAEMGVRSLILTNAAGGVNPNFCPGDLMLIWDHVNFTFDNPLIGTGFRPRFPDMSAPYDPGYIKIAEEVALNSGIKVQKGVLFCTTGPCYETPAEVRMIRMLGGDAVSMSTVPEVIAAVQRKMKVLGICCITNSSGDGRLSHQEVIKKAKSIRDKFIPLLKGVIIRIKDVR